MRKKFNVTGMTCSACSAHVEKAVSKVEGVKNVAVNLLSGNMNVDYDESITGDQAIIDAVVAAGYGASLPAATAKNKKAAAAAPTVEDEIHSMCNRLIISFIFFIPLMYVSMGHMIGLPLPGFLTGTENAIAFAMTQLLLAVPVMPPMEGGTTVTPPVLTLPVCPDTRFAVRYSPAFSV